VILKCWFIPGKNEWRTASHTKHPQALFSHCQDKGWMDFEVFCEWMHRFISVVKPMPKEQVLLILDGHSSHTQSLAAVEIDCKHDVVMSLPYHSTHRMQPLDVTFFKPLNTCHQRSQRSWGRNPGSVDGTYCVPGRHGVPKGCNHWNGYEWVQE
jgi:hypothetical protein